MGAFGGLILTNKGRALQAKAQVGTTLQYTRVAIGDGELGGKSIVELNALVSEKKSLGIRTLKYQGGGKAVIGSVLSNQDITEGFYFREIGIFALDPTEGEILYCYGNAGTNAEYIPVTGGPDIIEKTIDAIVLVGNAANVTAVIDNSLVFMTVQELEALKGQPNGIATLGHDGKVPSAQLPVVEVPVTSVNNKTGDVVLTASDVGAAPAVHGHTISNITGLQSALDGKETPTGAQTKANLAEQNAKNASLPLTGGTLTGQVISTHGLPFVSKYAKRVSWFIHHPDDDKIMIIPSTTIDGTTPNWEKGVTIGIDSMQVGFNTVWHMGNDGAGSGLDADTLDGFHAGTFLKTTDIVTGSYIGDDAMSRLISIGFTPRIVFLIRRDGILYLNGDHFGGLSITDSNATTTNAQTVVYIENGGFRVYNNSSAYQQQTNKSGYKYHYLAIK